MLMERICTPDYLQIMGIPLLQGRALTEADAAPDAQRVALISKKTAERYWPGKSPIGEHFKPRWLKIGGPSSEWSETSANTACRKTSPSGSTARFIRRMARTRFADSGPEAPPAELTLVIRTSQGNATRRPIANHRVQLKRRCAGDAGGNDEMAGSRGHGRRPARRPRCSRCLRRSQWCWARWEFTA